MPVVACTTAARAASPYVYFEDFESGTPTLSEGWTQSAPAAVAGGTNGIAAGVNGGTRFGLRSQFSPATRWMPPSPTPTPAGSWSFQIDFYPKEFNLPFFTPASTQGDDPSSMFSFNAEMTSFAVVGSSYRVNHYYSNLPTTVPLTPKWYRLEWAFVPGTTIDPVSGRPYVDYAFNVYEQARTKSDGYRSATLIAARRGILNFADYGGLRLAESTSSPSYFEIQSSAAAIDNFAVGPMINAPEPAVGAVSLAALGGS
jgi:hypothetical protein